MTRSSPRLLTMTFTTAAFGRSSSWLFEASPYRATPKGLPSSFAQLRITVWTGDARDTRMIEDMKLAGLSPATQATYIDAVRKLAAHYRRSPDQLSEEEVRAYILSLRERGVARGTFKTNYYGIRYLYRYTLNWDWALFSKKTSVCRARSGCPTPSPMQKSAGCLAA
jgi:hypothetical protein